LLLSLAFALIWVESSSKLVCLPHHKFPKIPRVDTSYPVHDPHCRRLVTCPKHSLISPLAPWTQQILYDLFGVRLGRDSKLSIGLSALFVCLSHGSVEAIRGYGVSRSCHIRFDRSSLYIHNFNFKRCHFKSQSITICIQRGFGRAVDRTPGNRSKGCNRVDMHNCTLCFPKKGQEGLIDVHNIEEISFKNGTRDDKRCFGGGLGMSYSPHVVS